MTMRKHHYITVICFCLAGFVLRAQVFSLDVDTDKPEKVPATGSAQVERMYHKYKGSYCRRYTFSQKNTHYRNDSVTGHSEWFEAIEFPDKFRIDFGDKTSGNFVVFRNDSSFSYYGGKLVKSKYNSNSLLLLLGGMYYRSYEEVLNRLKKDKYNMDVLSLQTWNGEEIYVIGAAKDDLNANQFWVDKKTWRVVRIIEKINDTDVMDMRFESHRRLCNGYVETKVSFRRNGRLEQVEEYENIKTENSFPAAVFFPD